MKLAFLIVAIIMFALAAAIVTFTPPANHTWAETCKCIGLAFFAGSFAVS